MEADSSVGTQGLTRATVGSSPESVSMGSAPPPALGPQAEQLITRGLGPSHQKASPSTAPPKDPAPPVGPARGPSRSTASCIRTQPHRQHLATSTRAGPGSRGGPGTSGPAVWPTAVSPICTKAPTRVHGALLERTAPASGGCLPLEPRDVSRIGKSNRLTWDTQTQRSRQNEGTEECFPGDGV